MVLLVVLSVVRISVTTKVQLLVGVVTIAVLLIVGLIVTAKGGANGQSLAPFTFGNTATGGFHGVFYGLIFGVTSFIGFESAADFGEETANPRRAVPIAILGAVIFAIVFYVFITYATTIGYGVNALQQDPTPWVNNGVAGVARMFGNKFAGEARRCRRHAVGVHRLRRLRDRRARVRFSRWAARASFPRGSRRPTRGTRRRSTRPSPSPCWPPPRRPSSASASAPPCSAATRSPSTTSSRPSAHSRSCSSTSRSASAASRSSRRPAAGSTRCIHGLIPLIGAVIFAAAWYGSIYPVPPNILKSTPYITAAWLVIGIGVVLWLSSRQARGSGPHRVHPRRGGRRTRGGPRSSVIDDHVHPFPLEYAPLELETHHARRRARRGCGGPPPQPRVRSAVAAPDAGAAGRPARRPARRGDRGPRRAGQRALGRTGCAGCSTTPTSTG